MRKILPVLVLLGLCAVLFNYINPWRKKSNETIVQGSVEVCHSYYKWTVKERQTSPDMENYCQ